MKNNAPPAPPSDAVAVAGELAHLLHDGAWHPFESLFSAVADSLCTGNDAIPCRELLRLHVYGRLQNWLRHGFVEQRRDSYCAHGPALVEIETHSAAEHCRSLLATVAATAKL